MSAWAVGVTVRTAVASARVTAKVFIDSSPISAHALGPNIRRGHAEQAYSEKLWQSTARFQVRVRRWAVSGSVDYRGFLAFGDRPGEFLFVADALQLVEGFVE